MNLDSIRGVIVEILEDSDDFASALPYPSAAVGVLPHVQLGFPQGRIELSTSTEVVIHDMPATCLVAMQGQYDQELKLAESLLAPFIRLMHTHLSLDGTVDYCQVTRYQTGVFRHGGVDHVGFIATLEIKEREHVALGG